MDKKILGRVAHGDTFYAAGKEADLEKVLSPREADHLLSVHAIEGDWNATAVEETPKPMRKGKWADKA